MTRLLAALLGRDVTPDDATRVAADLSADIRNQQHRQVEAWRRRQIDRLDQHAIEQGRRAA